MCAKFPFLKVAFLTISSRVDGIKNTPRHLISRQRKRAKTALFFPFPKRPNSPACEDGFGERVTRPVRHSINDSPILQFFTLIFDAPLK
jgi:hypothetical protein